MSSIIASGNQARTNRWLLIGAAALAVLTGILVFVAIANFGDSGGTTTSGTGDASVLVARQTIPANTTITADMLATRKVSKSDLVPGAVSDTSAVLGKATRVDILQNQQISFDAVGVGSKVEDAQPAVLVPPGMRGVSVTVSENTSVAGLINPGDYVDVVGIFQQNNQGNQQQVVRVETLLQNVVVIAFAQTTQEAIPPPAATAEASATAAAGVYGQAPTFKANPSARTITLALSPHDVEVILAAQAKGTLTLVLRRPGEKDTAPVPVTLLGELGFLPPTPTP